MKWWYWCVLRPDRERLTYALWFDSECNWKLRDYMFAASMEFSLHLHIAINSFGIIVVHGEQFLLFFVFLSRSLARHSLIHFI